MLKPVRIVETDHNNQLLKFAAREFATTLSFILMGPQVEVSNFDAFCMPIATYLQSYRRKSVLLNIEIERDPNRRIYAFFEFNAAITLGGVMRQHQDATIQQKIQSGEFSGEIRDAFGEIGNQFTGALDRIVRDHTHAKAHLILDFKRHVYPDEAIALDHFIDKEEYVVWLADVTVAGYPKHKLTVLFPISFYEDMAGQRIHLQGIAPKKILLHSWDKAFAESIAKRIYSRHFVVETVDQYSDIVHRAKEPNVCIVCLDLDGLANPISHDHRIFAKRMQNAKIPDSVPFWVSMKHPDSGIGAQLELEGLRGVNMRDAKKDLLGWIQEQIGKIPINN